MPNTSSAPIAMLAVIVALAGCASQRAGPPPATPAQNNQNQRQNPGANAGANRKPAKPPSPAQGRRAAPPRHAAATSSPAVMSLLGRADTLAKAGHMQRAAATLERALDLAPRNPFIYQRLAVVRLAQGQTSQAEELARKSNSVAGRNPFVKADNWRLIAEARRTDGNSSGARAASARAVNFDQAGRQYPQ